jgi:Predicted transcriptional regulators
MQYKVRSVRPADQYVGGRIRVRRMELKVSQEKLGEALGLTFQQVQKYEKGKNRIGASRLTEIADVLKVPVSYFFFGLPQHEAPDDDFSVRFFNDRQAVQLVEKFMQATPAVRKAVVDLIYTLTE